jgi:hypothetical protein
MKSEENKKTRKWMEFEEPQTGLAKNDYFGYWYLQYWYGMKRDSII